VGNEKTASMCMNYYLILDTLACNGLTATDDPLLLDEASLLRAGKSIMSICKNDLAHLEEMRHKEKGDR
jgi:hypothetical protein